jgi:hypothetical protein
MSLISVQEFHEILGPERNFMENLADGLSAAIDSSLQIAKKQELDEQLISDCITLLLLSIAAERITRINPSEDRERLGHYFMTCAAETLSGSFCEASESRHLHS